MFLFSCVLGAGCPFRSCKGHGLLKNVENLQSVVSNVVRVIVATCEDICDAVDSLCAALFFERFDHYGRVYITLDSQVCVGDDDHRWHSWFKLKMRNIYVTAIPIQESTNPKPLILLILYIQETGLIQEYIYNIWKIISDYCIDDEHQSGWKMEFDHSVEGAG